jgi:hypothetical protein
VTSRVRALLLAFPSPHPYPITTVLTLHTVWEAAAEDEARTKAQATKEQETAQAEIQKRREEIRRQAMSEEK